jgi:hypothetical protein
MRKIVGIILGYFLSSFDVPQSIRDKFSVVVRSRVNNLAVGCEGMIHILRSVSISHEDISTADVNAAMQDLLQVFRMALRNPSEILSCVDLVFSHCDSFDGKRILTLVDPVNSPFWDVLHCIKPLSGDLTFLHFNRIKVWHQ